MNNVPQSEVRSVRKQISLITDKFLGLAAESCGDFACVEEAARIAILSFREVLLTSGLRTSSKLSKQTYQCPNCSAALSGWIQKDRCVVTSEGEASYQPIRYRCANCCKDHYPLEEANGLHGSQFTTGAKAIISETAAEKPFAHVSRSLCKERGISVSSKEVDRIVREVSGWRSTEEAWLTTSIYGEEAALLREAGSDPMFSAPSLHGFGNWAEKTAVLISVDGAHVRSTTKETDSLAWFECRSGVIRSLGDGPVSTFYSGGVWTPDELFSQLGAVYHKDVASDQVSVFVADGASWIWDRVRLYFPKAIQVLDYYHANEHVGSAAVALFGENSQASKEWREKAAKRLLEPGGITSILKDILQVMREPNRAAKPDELRKEFNYLYKHRKRMQYFSLREKELPIGSGVMESAIKQLAVTRLRMPGMKWTKEGANAVLKLRAAHLSHSLRMTTDRKHNALKAQSIQRYTIPLKVAA